MNLEGEIEQDKERAKLTGVDTKRGEVEQALGGGYMRKNESVLNVHAHTSTRMYVRSHLGAVSLFPA